MSAYCTQTRTSIINPFHPVKYSADQSLVTKRLPDISVSFPSLPPTEILEAIHSEGGQELHVKGTKIFLLPSPESSLLRTIAKGGANRTTPAAIGSVNLDALASLSFIRRIFSNFLLTHQYPAFIDTDHLEYTEAHWQLEKGTKRLLESAGTAGAQKRTRITRSMEAVAEGDVQMEVESQEVVRPSDRIVWALPPPKLAKGWGDELDLPAGDGLFIRYVDETQNSQGEKAIHETLNRYFLGCFGESHNAVFAMHDRVKRDLGVIIQTAVGRELAHIAKCIDLGLQAQARIFPLVSEDQYLGCCLLGAGFHIQSYGTIWSSVSTIALKQRIDAASSHKSALTAIAKIASPDPDSEAHTSIADASTMMELRKVLSDAYLNNEDRDKIVTLAKSLRYVHRSLHVSSPNIAMCLDFIGHPERDLPTSFPIHPTMLFEQNRISVVWSAFGELAPTCHFVGGPSINLGGVRDLPKHIGFRLIALKDAIIDLEQILSSKRFSNCTLNRRSGPFKDRIYQGNDASRILSALCEIAGVVRDKGKKREGGSGNVDLALLDEGF